MVLLALGVSAAPKSGISDISQGLHGTDPSRLPPAPPSLGQDTLAFLRRYQNLSDEATATLQPNQGDSFVDSGYCYAEFPCLSINRVGVANIGHASVIDGAHVQGLLDGLVAQPTLTMDASHPNSVLYGTRAEHDGLVLEIISPPGSVSSHLVAGMVFDMYKAQAHGETTNAIRAVPAPSTKSSYSGIALCLFPADAENSQTTNFCLGRNLDGSKPETKVQRRDFSLDGLLLGLCKAIDIPLICS